MLNETTLFEVRDPSRRRAFAALALPLTAGAQGNHPSKLITAFPAIPMMDETQLVKNFNFDLWLSLMVPKATPDTNRSLHPHQRHDPRDL